MRLNYDVTSQPQALRSWVCWVALHTGLQAQATCLRASPDLQYIDTFVISFCFGGEQNIPLRMVRPVWSCYFKC